MRFLRVSESKSPPNSSKRDFIPICDGLWNATTQATLSRNGFAIEVSCCVKTQTDKPACLPENARFINLLVRFWDLLILRSHQVLLMCLCLRKNLHKFQVNHLSFQRCLRLAKARQNVCLLWRIPGKFYFWNKLGRSIQSIQKHAEKDLLVGQ